MSEVYTSVSEFLIKARKVTKKSLRDFAQGLGENHSEGLHISHETIYRWEHGTQPRMKTLIQLARIHPPTTWQGIIVRGMLHKMNPVIYPIPGTTPDLYWH